MNKRQIKKKNADLTANERYLKTVKRAGEKTNLKKLIKSVFKDFYSRIDDLMNGIGVKIKIWHSSE